MRNDMAPFTDKRVRRAIALCLDRHEAGQGPVPRPRRHRQRQPVRAGLPLDRQDGAAARAATSPQAKQLLAAAGFANGFKVKLTTEKYLEIPEYAEVIQNAVQGRSASPSSSMSKARMPITARRSSASPTGSIPIMGITDYGHRGVPNVLLSAPLKSDGTWNSAHFKNKEYDTLVSAVHRAPSTCSPSAGVAGKIQRLLLDETPGPVHLFLRLPDGDDEEGGGRAGDGDGPALPGPRFADLGVSGCRLASIGRLDAAVRRHRRRVTSAGGAVLAGRSGT